ncbi:MAG: alanine--tRNA ligase, partial [Bacteroidota bacterium]
MNAREIRQAFLDFFNSKGHHIVPSAPIVVKGDPTLMFTNAGMNQFKDLFLGHGTVEYKRIANSQKCLRVSGKHNDLEEVGVDTYHHTMFEMLGNWSFGDYFKEDAITWAWELLTEVYKLPKDRLYVTVFEGDEKEGLAFDQEAFDIWKRYIAEERILKGNKKDNFWEMGETGPCGPCSEIHIDIRTEEERAKIDGKSLVNESHPQVIEIWNNVFMQFNRKASGELEPLPNKHVDTGMGFERLCVALQGKQSNYDTDVFSPLIDRICKTTGVTYSRSDSKQDIAIRVIADHVRAVSFTIADGQLPASGGAGYVIRRILRRAIRYGYSFLNRRDPFIFELVDVLAAEMGTFFPEIIANRDLVKRVIRDEEESFLRTLEKGIQLLEEHLHKGAKKLDGRTVFELYDTFGFPFDLTSLIASEKGVDIDAKGFEEELEKQKERSRNATKLETDDWVELDEGETEFVGYDQLECETKILKYRKIKSKGKESFQLVLSQTPFYAEGGGQVGDTGILKTINESIVVVDTKKENNLSVHFVEQLPENVHASFSAVVDKSKRESSQRNHSVTHLLHEALREVLGAHVEQKGSLVNSDYLRFDFSHFSKVSDEELKQVEQLVNGRIRAAFPLKENRSATMDEARAQGAMMLFGEKYGSTVRVIQFGTSVELCGGTHVSSTSDIRSFQITSEAAVAAGIRRIEAITADAVDALLEAEHNELEAVRALVKNKNASKAVEDLLSKFSLLEKELDALKHEKSMQMKGVLKEKFTEKNGMQVLIEQVDLDANAIKDICFQLKSEIEKAFICLCSVQNGKPTIAIALSDSLVNEKKWNAGSLIKEWSKEIKGGGGGQAFFATAGGNDASGITKV